MIAAAVRERRRAPNAGDVPVRACAEESQEPAPAGRQAKEDPTLEELICALWGQVSAGRTVACPLCGCDLEPRYAAHATPVAGRCRGCATCIE